MIEVRYSCVGVMSSQVEPPSGVLSSALVWMQSKGSVDCVISPSTGLVPLQMPCSTKAQPMPSLQEGGDGCTYA